MKILKVLNVFFVGLGILFFIILIIVGYVWIADPFGLKTLGISPASLIKTMDGSNTAEIDNVDKNPLLTEEQEAQLEALGINPASLPTEITPEMEKCFVDKLGEQRTQEIIQGDAPNAFDFYKSRSCL